MKSRGKNYLGIDWGSSKIGIAFSDSETKMAFTYGVLKNDKNILEKVFEIVEEKEVGVIVIGVPMYLSGEKREIFGGKKFGMEILKKGGVEVVYQNEMFSTKIAERNLIERGMKKIKRFDDAESARIILESWLNENKWEY